MAVCPASIQFRKGQDLLVDYAAEIIHHIPNFRGLLLGSVPPDWKGPEILQRIETSPYRENFQHIAFSANALDYLYASDVVILPSRSEALPRCILEAMALGTPVIASDVDGIPEMIEHEHSGLLFPSSESERLVEALIKIYADRDWSRHLAERARQRYWDHFSRAHQIERYRKLVQELTEPQPTGFK
jgi:glycosyltransferase involved in cell wall biosynthesis